MKLDRGVALGFLAGGAFALLVALAQGIEDNGLFVGLVFVAIGPLFDRIALRVAGDAGPRAFWNAAAWLFLALFVGLDTYKDFGHVGWGTCAAAVFLGPLGASCAVGWRALGFRTPAALRRALPWVAIAALFAAATSTAARSFTDLRDVNIEVGVWFAPKRVAVLAFASIGLALVILRFRPKMLARLRGLEDDWRRGTMSVDGLVTVDGLPPMHAPAGIAHFAGPVAVLLDAPPEATFRTTGAPKVRRLLQGIDADLDGRRGVLDEGAGAHATAAVLLVGAATFVSLLLTRG